MALFKGGLFNAGLFKSGLFGRITETIANIAGGGQLRRKRKLVYQSQSDRNIILRGVGNISSSESFGAIKIEIVSLQLVRSREDREKEFMLLLSMKIG
jgi:hypothetical protein